MLINARAASTSFWSLTRARTSVLLGNTQRRGNAFATSHATPLHPAGFTAWKRTRRVTRAAKRQKIIIFARREVRCVKDDVHQIYLITPTQKSATKDVRQGTTRWWVISLAVWLQSGNSRPRRLVLSAVLTTTCTITCVPFPVWTCTFRIP